MNVRPEPSRGDLLLQTEGLVKAYRGRRVVDGVGFTVRAGEIVGLIRPDAGRVSLNGAECSKLPMFRRARLGMGYLPQEPSVFRRMSVRNNLLAVLESMPLSRAERRAEADRLLADLELGHLAGNLAETLSGGERRRLELCRALATRPTILLLDEPFAGIDPIAVQEIQGLVHQMRRRNIGILITDHNVRETLRSTDRAYIIHNGHILREGTADDLIGDPRVREVYLGHSFDAPVRGVSAAEEREFFED